MSLILTFVIGSILFLTPSAAHAVQLDDTAAPDIAGAPDLTGTITKATVRIKPSGHKLVVKPTICNEGNGEAGAFEVGLYLSTDASWDENDEKLDSLMIESLAPSACVQTDPAPKFKVKELSSLDGRFALVVIDPDSAVASEFNTTNNVISEALEGPFLSSGKVRPGQFLTIADDSIVEESTIEVTFSGANGYVVKTTTSLTTSGQAKVAVPPYVNLTTNAFISGIVSVEISGSSGRARLKIRKLPKVDATPGAITREVLRFMVDNFDRAQANIESISSQNGEDFSDWLDIIAQISAPMQAMESELATQQLTVDTDTDTIVLTDENLLLIDRMLAAYILGIDKEIQAQVPQSAVTGISLIQERQRALTTGTVQFDNIANALQRLKNGSIAKVKLYGSFVSVAAGVGGLYAAVGPGTQEFVPATAIAVTSTVTVLAGSTAISMVLDFGTSVMKAIDDTLPGENVELGDVIGNTLDEVIDGVGSLVLTGLGAFKWAGATLASVVSLASDTQSEIQAATTPPPATDASEVTVPIPGFSIDFSSSEVIDFVIDDTIVPNVPVINATGTFNDGAGVVSLLLAFDPLQISGPGTYTFSTTNDTFFNQAGEVALLFSTSDITDVSTNRPVLFFSTSGNLKLTVYEPVSGGRLTGTFTATLEGQQVTPPPEGDEDPTIVILTGTISGSFDVPVL